MTFTKIKKKFLENDKNTKHIRKCSLLVIFTLQNFLKLLNNSKTGAVLKPNHICFEILEMLAFHGFTV